MFDVAAVFSLHFCGLWFFSGFSVAFVGLSGIYLAFLIFIFELCALCLCVNILVKVFGCIVSGFWGWGWVLSFQWRMVVRRVISSLGNWGGWFRCV